MALFSTYEWAPQRRVATWDGSQSFLNNFTILLSYISTLKNTVKKMLTYKVILHKKGIGVEIGGKRDTFLEIEEKRETS